MRDELNAASSSLRTFVLSVAATRWIGSPCSRSDAVTASNLSRPALPEARRGARLRAASLASSSASAVANCSAR
eukprot:scaffold48063_cov28-Tisochrysis_lutea.AAC.4